MPGQQQIDNFSKRKQHFFKSLRSAAHARNLVKYQYDVAIMPTDVAALEKNKLYLAMYEDRFTYKFIGSSGQVIEDFIDAETLQKHGVAVGAQLPQAPLTLAQLGPFLPAIRKVTSERGHNGFHFVAENRSFIEQDFADLYARLSSENEHQEVLLLCYFWCYTLEDYYSDASYPDPNKANKYCQLRRELEYRCQQAVLIPTGFAQPIDDYIGKQIVEGFNDLVDTVQHTSAIRAWLGFVNVYRILFLFSRLAIRQGLVMAHQLKWLDNLAQLLNRNIDLNALVSMINSPTGIFNALSVGIFEIRLVIMLCEALKHIVLDPTEKEDTRTKMERFKEEIWGRILDIYNDVAWSLVNTFCNYGYLAGPVADWLTATFLLLDAVVLVCRLYLAHQDYKVKKAQYEFEKTLLTAEDVVLRDMIDRQLRELEIDWTAKQAELLFNTAAAVLLMGGFSASLLLTGPAVVTACFVACTVALAMFLSAGKYGAYTKESLYLNHDAERDKAYSAFAVSMVKNSVMPLVMVTAFAVYWPAALVLAAAYITYESSGKPPARNMPEWQPADGHDKAQDEIFEEDRDCRQMIAV